ncbi:MULTISPECIES: hypothetical protein [Asaia]|uniref:hypothetical protein n=1 Tax=Asaia TaxID=91914 RepID=UPI0013CE7B9D|nr:MULTISPECIES: hypothetical protein [Asaia]MDL2172501.1 hypothetical protein [Asaia sp. HumB]
MLDLSSNDLPLIDLDIEDLDFISGAIPWKKIGEMVLQGGEAAYNFAGGVYEGFNSF